MVIDHNNANSLAQSEINTTILILIAMVLLVVGLLKVQGFPKKRGIFWEML